MKLFTIKGRMLVVDSVFFDRDALHALVYDPKVEGDSVQLYIMSRKQCEDNLIADNLSVEYLEDFNDSDYLREFRPYFVDAIATEFCLPLSKPTEQRNWLLFVLFATITLHIIVLWLAFNGHFFIAPVLYFMGMGYLCKLIKAKNYFK